jgi:pimeloyl-ACP methyl ester carboxylesterase
MTIATTAPLQHRNIKTADVSLHVVEGGASSRPAFLFVHGWPEDWSVFESVMAELAASARVVAMDLPGIGASEIAPPSNDKRALCRYLNALIEAMQLKNVTLVGHDIGGLIAYAFLRAFPGTLARAAIMNIAIPGVEPWPAVVRDPHIWHFAFHAIPKLPETLVTGRISSYFDYFFEQLAGPTGVPRSKREVFVRAYSRPDALRTGFEWYRAFPHDENDNKASHGQAVTTPVLYLRGEQDRGAKIEEYLEGLRAAGLANLRGETIAQSGHFAPLEQPARVAASLSQFAQLPA